MLVDAFQRRIEYLRLSVTDRCDFRCTYCMAEDMTFLPRSEILSLEELEEVVRAFVALGVQKVRVTGGEPLVRRGIVPLLRRLGQIPGLATLALTTNGSQLAGQARTLRQAGVSALNISLDSLDPGRFRRLTRHGELAPVLAGIEDARQARFPRIRLNSVLLRDENADEAPALLDFAIQQGLDIAFIEEMPLGEVAHSRQASFVSSDEVRQQLQERFSLLPCPETTGGPARYYRVAGSTSRVGFISPHSHNFCDRCNRLRVTARGRLLLCLGHEQGVELKPILRAPGYRPALLQEAIREALSLKPEKHDFRLSEPVQILRFMNTTGG